MLEGVDRLKDRETLHNQDGSIREAPSGLQIGAPSVRRRMA